MKYRNYQLYILLPVFFIVVHQTIKAQQANVALTFTVSMQQPASHVYHVSFKCTGIKRDTIEFKIPNRMPKEDENGYEKKSRQNKAVQNNCPAVEKYPR